ncbi:DNA polymerase III subunit chi [Pleomorphomonas sp. JP5]|uniref:DNA polymerase III subunit chi n=1 Tax=Pleomorphomonas sp. JP5 TaxID=2942998 RepID=UPI0020435994|nr:DNA polymerase III subunit chi [Pleomorphomonas sp. JP5]MCM5558357.1 DNA polymerase III subunit chi [Pleomorphomonas sp. JP5]
MTEALFYHLDGQPLERVLPVLLQKSVERGWRVVVEAGTPERLAALDSHLWTFDDAAFLPHGTAADGHATLQPVYLAAGPEVPNDATVRFLVDRAPLPDDTERYERLVLIFDGTDETARAEARAAWKTLKERGVNVTYWQQDGEARWTRKA